MCDTIYHLANWQKFQNLIVHGVRKGNHTKMVWGECKGSASSMWGNWQDLSKFNFIKCVN